MVMEKQNLCAHLLHVVARSYINDDMLGIRQFSGNIERVGERHQDGFVWSNASSIYGPVI